MLVAAFALLLAPIAEGAGLRNPRLHDLAGAPATRFHQALPYKPLPHARELRAGEYLRCSGTCVVALHDGPQIELPPQAPIRAEPPVFPRRSPDEMAQRAMTFSVAEGRVMVRRPAQTTTPLVVSARGGIQIALPSGSAWVKATEERTAVVTTSSEAVYRRGSVWLPLPAEELHVLHASMRHEVLPVVGMPAWTTHGRRHRPLGLSVDGATTSVGGTWGAGPGAASYEVELEPEPGVEVDPVRIQTQDTYFVASLPEGRYHARVSATDPEGMITRSSAPMPIRIVRAGLPPSGFVPQSGTIVVPETTQVELLDTRDVEVSVNGRGFYPAPPKLPAPKDVPTLVRVRLAGDPASAAPFRVEKRALRASVTLSPALPTWPEDDIQIRVQLEDPSRLVDLQHVAASVEVKLGREVIATKWKRVGSTYTATIEGRALHQPSLLRVQVKDGAGYALGWGFAEIVAGVN